jgi:hypothetical protein
VDQDVEFEGDVDVDSIVDVARGPAGPFVAGDHDEVEVKVNRRGATSPSTTASWVEVEVKVNDGVKVNDRVNVSRPRDANASVAWSGRGDDARSPTRRQRERRVERAG